MSLVLYASIKDQLTESSLPALSAKSMISFALTQKCISKRDIQLLAMV